MYRLILILPLFLLLLPTRREPAVAQRPPSPEPVIQLGDDLPSAERFAELARTDPIACLRAGALRHRREVAGYQAVLIKQETIGGKLYPQETIDVCFRSEPFSVLMRWKSESIGRADRALYVHGANDNLMLAHPKNRAARMLVGDVVARDPDGPDAKAAGRLSLREFGMGRGAERTLREWEAARQRGQLDVEYLGIRTIAECGGRAAHVFHRTCRPPEDDGIVAFDVALDAETWLQIGTVLSGDGGRLIAAYHFRDIALNPSFTPDQFDRVALTRD